MNNYIKHLLLCCFLLAGIYTDAQNSHISFTVSMPAPETHYFHVELSYSGNTKTVLNFTMPAWMPGYYQLMDYAKNVEHFSVKSLEGKVMKWQQSSQNVWIVDCGAVKNFSVSYDVKADRKFVANSYLDSERAYISPAGIFLYTEENMQQPVTVVIKPFAAWKNIATGLEPVHGKKNTYTANNFDILYDCPVLAGNLEELPSFSINKIPHRFVGYKLGDFEKNLFMDELKKVVQAGIDIIGDIPYTHYTFIAIGPGRGGIEHLNNTTVSFEGSSLNTTGGKERMMSFLAHEYFHHYNVKRIRPAELGPFDYTKPNRSNQLWISEGLTVYYEYLMLRRAGLTNDEDLLNELQSNIAAYENGVGHLYQSLVQASYETWSDGPFGRKTDSVNKTISYYEKGPAIGMLLDFTIRNATNNKNSLDDVMRFLYKTYYQQKQRGFTEAEFQQACETIAGISLNEMFEYIYTAKEVDYNKYLGYAGLQIDLLPGDKNIKSCKISRKENTDELQKAIFKSWTEGK